MENKEIKKETNVVSNPKVDKKENEEKGLILNKTLDLETLVIENEELKPIISKTWVSLTDDERKKLPTAKLKIIERRNTYTRQVINIARVILSSGVYIDKRLEASEYTLLKRYYPELFVKSTNKQELPSVMVPMKLTSSFNQNGARSFRYNIELCPMVYSNGRMVNGKRQNYLALNQIQLLLIDDTAYRFVNIDYEIDESEINPYEEM